MKNKIEEKISKFIKETEVSNLVAPELNVDRDRDEWLRKQGKKESREVQAAGYMEGANDTVNCPNCQGTGNREGKKCWVCRGSGKLTHLAWEKHYGNPATMKKETRFEPLQVGDKVKDKYDGKTGVIVKKYGTETIDVKLDSGVIRKNYNVGFVDKIQEEAYNPVTDLGNYMKKKKYGFSPEDISNLSEESLIGKEVGFETYVGGKFKGERGKIIKKLFNGKYVIKTKNGQTVERNPDEVYK